MTFNNIVNSIESLPPLSNAANIIRSLYASGADNIDVTRLTKIIESDAMLAAYILKMINSPYYNLPNKIHSVNQAVSLFGMRNIYMLVINYSMRQHLKADPSIYGFTSSQFNDVCHLQSSLMFQWYLTINEREAHFLAPLALIMESGKLILAKEVIESDYAGEFRKGFNECEDIQEYEKSLLDVTSYYLTAVLFKHWNLEPKYVSILKALDTKEEKPKIRRREKTYEKELNIIRTAINVKEVLTDDSIQKAKILVKEMGYDDEKFEEIAMKTRNSYLSI